MSLGKDYGYFGKEGYHTPQENIPGLLRCKDCGSYPILKVDKMAYSFFCNCRGECNRTPATNMKMAISLWNSNNLIELPTARELDMLKYIGIAMNARTFLRLSRWKASSVAGKGSFRFVTTLSNGLNVYAHDGLPDDTFRLINKTDLKVFGAQNKSNPSDCENESAKTSGDSSEND